MMMWNFRVSLCVSGHEILFVLLKPYNPKKGIVQSCRILIKLYGFGCCLDIGNWPYEAFSCLIITLLFSIIIIQIQGSDAVALHKIVEHDFI